MENILHLTSENFDDTLKNNSLVLVDFWATWCAPCRMIAPVLEELAERYKDDLILGKVDVDEESSLASKYNIQSIPTVILFKDGQIVATEIGVNSLDVYEEMLV